MTPNQSSETKRDSTVVADLLPPQDEHHDTPTQNLSQQRITGEHPLVRATSTDNEIVSVASVPFASEITSTNLQNSEPEDTLPDYLDQHR